MILYIEVLDSKLLELINEFSKITGIRSQKSVVFLHTSNKQSEKEIKKYSIYNSIRKDKLPRHLFNQGGENCTLKTTSILKE